METKKTVRQAFWRSIQSHLQIKIPFIILWATGLVILATFGSDINSGLVFIGVIGLFCAPVLSFWIIINGFKVFRTIKEFKPIIYLCAWIMLAIFIITIIPFLLTIPWVDNSSEVNIKDAAAVLIYMVIIVIIMSAVLIRNILFQRIKQSIKQQKREIIKLIEDIVK